METKDIQARAAEAEGLNAVVCEARTAIDSKLLKTVTHSPSDKVLDPYVCDLCSSNVEADKVCQGGYCSESVVGDGGIRNVELLEEWTTTN